MAATLRQKLKSVAVRIGLHTGPSFLIIGAQKCGTTSLHEYLRHHPVIIPGLGKEVNYFAQDRLYARGAHWYHEQFPTRMSMPAGSLTFEATPEYVYFPECAARIHAYNPALRLIVLLREPVERAYSAWNMVRGWHAQGASILGPLISKFDPDKQEKHHRMLALPDFPDFDSVIREELDLLEETPIGADFGYVKRGLYAAQLRRYLELFPRSQLLVMPSERFLSDRTAVLDEVTDFLGLPPHAWETVELHQQHQGRYDQELPASTQELLGEFYRPHNEELQELVGSGMGWR